MIVDIMSEPNALKLIHTSCMNCVFAEYNGITQVDCNANKLDMYEDVISAYNEEKEFFIINGKKCLFKRIKPWIGTPSEARKEIKFLYKAIVIADKTEKDVATTISSLPFPSAIDIVRPIDSLADVAKLREQMVGTSIKWKIHNLMNNKAQYKKKPLDHYCQLALTNNKIPYVCIIYSGEILPTNTLETLWNNVLDEGLEFELIYSDKIFIVPFLIWKYYYLMGSRKQCVMQNILNDEQCKKVYAIQSI